jgi:hypothetical protein
MEIVFGIAVGIGASLKYKAIKENLIIGLKYNLDILL